MSKITFSTLSESDKKLVEKKFNQSEIGWRVSENPTTAICDPPVTDFDSDYVTA